MNELFTIVVLLLAGSIVAAALFWRKIARLEDQMRAQGRQVEEREQEIEKVRRELKDRRDEVEQSKKLLLETKTKLKKQQKESPQTSPGSKRIADFEPLPVPSATAIIRVTDQEVEAAHQRALEKLQSALDAALAELQKLKDERSTHRDDDKTLEMERGTLRPAELNAPPVPAPYPAAASPSLHAAPAAHELDALRAQLDLARKTATERERTLRSELRRAQENAASASRRATNNHQLYQVIKGQLELTEDRLATLRRKYEGAKTAEELRREQRKRGESARRAPPESRPGNGAHEAEAESGPERAVEAPPPSEAVAQAEASVSEELPSEKSIPEPETRGDDPPANVPIPNS